jgi:hypothetical protein
VEGGKTAARPKPAKSPASFIIEVPLVMDSSLRSETNDGLSPTTAMRPVCLFLVLVL